MVELDPMAGVGGPVGPEPEEEPDENARRIMNFGLADEATARRLSQDSQFQPYHEQLKGYEDAANRTAERTLERNPSADPELVRARVMDSFSMRMLSPITDATGKASKNPPISPVSRNTLLRSIFENIPLGDAVYDSIADPAVAGEYESVSNEDARAAIATRKKALFERMNRLSGIDREVGQMDVGGELETAKQPVARQDLVPFFSAPDGFSDTYRQGGLPSLGDATKALLNDMILGTEGEPEIPSGDVERYSRAAEIIRNGWSPEVPSTYGSDPAMRETVEWLENKSRKKLENMGGFGSEVEEREWSFNGMATAFLQHHMEMNRDNAWTSSFGESLALWPLRAYKNAAGELMDLGESPTTVPGGAQEHFQRQSVFMEALSELDKKSALLERSDSVSSEITGNAFLWEDENGQKFVRVESGTEYIAPDPEAMPAPGHPARQAFAQEEAERFSKYAPRDYPYVDDDQVLIKDGDEVVAGQKILKNTAQGGADPMDMAELHEHIRRNEMSPQFLSWFEDKWELRWNPEEMEGGYVRTGEDPWANELATVNAAKDAETRLEVLGLDPQSALGMAATAVSVPVSAFGEFWDKASSDPATLAANFNRNIVETVAVVPMAAIYLANRAYRTATKSKHERVLTGELPYVPDALVKYNPALWVLEYVGDVTQDVATLAPAAVRYMVEEASYPSRYFFRNPMDALALVSVGTGAMRTGTAAAARAAAPATRAEAALVRSGLRWSEKTGWVDEAGAAAGAARDPQAVLRGVQETLAEGIDQIPFRAEGPRRPLGFRQKEAMIELLEAPRPTPLKQGFREGLRLGAQFGEYVHSLTNPLEFIKQLGGARPLIAYGIDRFAPDKVKVGLDRVALWFEDPSETLRFMAVDPAGNVHFVDDLFAQAKGRSNAQADEAIKEISSIADEDAASLERIMRGMEQDGYTFFVEVSDNMMDMLPANIAREVTQTGAYSELVKANDFLIEARKVDRAALDKLEVAKRNVETRKPTKKELENYEKTGKLPRGTPLGTPLDESTRIVVVKKKGSAGYEDYKAYRDAYKAQLATGKEYNRKINGFLDRFDHLVKQIPKNKQPIARQRIPEWKHAERLMDGGEPRFRVREPSNLGLDLEFPTRKKVNTIYERARKDAQRAVATGGGGTTIEEMAKRFAGNEAIQFVPGNHIAAAGNLKLLAQLRGQLNRHQLHGALELADLPSLTTLNDYNKADLLSEAQKHGIRATEDMTNGQIITSFQDEAARILNEKWDGHLAEMGLDKLTDAQRGYLEWVGEYMDAPTLEGAVGVYGSRLGPNGEVVHIQQLSDDLMFKASYIRTKLMNLGARSVKLGLLPKNIFLSNVAVYFPDYYKQYSTLFKEAIEAGDVKFAGKKHLIQGDRFRKRRLAELTEEQRYEAGRIDEARYTAIRGITELAHDVEKAQLFNDLSTMKYLDGPHKGQRLAIPHTSAYDRVPPHEGWIRMPDSARYGKLANTWMSKEMALYMKRSVEIPHWTAMYWRKIWAPWKFAMTILNPATHTRNVISNMVMADAAGMNPIFSESARFGWKGAFKEAWKQEGVWYQRAIEDGLMGTDFVNAELRAEVRGLVGDVDDLSWRWNGDNPEAPIQAALNMSHSIVGEIGNQLKKGGRYAGKKIIAGGDHAAALYTFEEEVFKLARYKQLWRLWDKYQKTGNLSHDMVRAIGGRDEALRFANMGKSQMRGYIRRESNKWFFDYSDVSSAVEFGRTVWSPFMTFQYKAIPRVMSHIHQNPLKAFYYRRLFETLNTMNEYMDGTPPDPQAYMDRQMEYESLPAYARMTSIRLPGKEMVRFHGREPIQQSRWLDVQHYTPMGGMMTPSLDWNPGLLPDILEPRHPVLSTAIGPFFYNRPSYNTDHVNISMPGLDSYSERLYQRSEEALRNMLPPLFGIPGTPFRGRSFQKLEAAATGSPYPNVPEGRIDSMPTAILDAMFGYRSFAVNLERSGVEAVYDRRLSEITRDANRKRKLPHVVGNDAEEQKVFMQEQKALDVLNEWYAKVHQDAAVEASMMGRAMGTIKDPGKSVSFPLPGSKAKKKKMMELIRKAQRESKR